MTADETAGEKTVDSAGTADAGEAVEAAPTEEGGGSGVVPARPKCFTAQVKKRSSDKAILAPVMGLLVVALLGLLGMLYCFSYLPDRDTDAAAAQAAIAAASEGTVAVMSYSPETLDRDFSSAKSHLTGDFLTYYNQFTQQIVAPVAKQKSVKASAVVLRAALSEFHPNSAVALLFVNQSTLSKDRPEPSLMASSVVVALTKADGKWLISSLNRV
ncbi:MAG: twin-arginine translocation pathway signal [Mycobacterium sp.]|nr:twin-arginine translocation pathway signal [Mycobacterium sp.]